MTNGGVAGYTLAECGQGGHGAIVDAPLAQADVKAVHKRTDTAARRRVKVTPGWSRSCRKGADVKAAERRMGTPLHMRQRRPQRGRRRAARTGADVKAVARWEDPAARCGARGDTAIVDALLAHGANAKAVNDFGRTPLHGRRARPQRDRRRAAKRGRRRTAKDNDGESPADLPWRRSTR